MPIVPVRVVAVALLAVVAAGCADEQAATPRPVEERSATSRATTTTVVAPPVTKPLVTAPPSPLLDEVVAAYDAAYADLLAAEAIPDENYPALGNHIDDGQLGQWRSVIRRLRTEGFRIVAAAPADRWRRIESFHSAEDGSVEIVVCRHDPDSTVTESGVVASLDDRAFRYRETFERVSGVWKWAGREWLDDGSAHSDCALP